MTLHRYVDEIAPKLYYRFEEENHKFDMLCCTRCGETRKEFSTIWGNSCCLVACLLVCFEIGERRFGDG